jgi:carbon monoxide dehydrogenase subunit G
VDIKESFSVNQPLGDVWDLFLDVPEVARCLPGAELTADNGDGTYGGKLSVKLGPIAASFEGTATVTADESTHTMSIEGKGVDRSGGSQGRVNVEVILVEADNSSTEVTIDSHVMLAGPIAQFGRTGLVSEVSKRLLDDFSACLHAKLQAADPIEKSEIKAGEVKGISLFLASLWSWFKGLFSK